jgi:repressor LexA
LPIPKKTLRQEPSINLTPKQLDLVRYIERYRRRWDMSPTLGEMAHRMGTSEVTVFEHLGALERKGVIRRTPRLARSVEIVRQAEDPPLRLLGTIAAGRPIEAIEDPQEIDLSGMLRRGREHFVLQVSGNSMIDEHIRDGDYVIIEKRSTASSGETVVALLADGEATLKKFYREKGRIRLQPANPDMEPIYVDDVRIQGVVVGVLRKY